MCLTCGHFSCLMVGRVVASPHCADCGDAAAATQPETTQRKGTAMGLFKQMKQMKDMMEDAPDQIRNARAMGAQAQEMATAQQAAAQAQMAQMNASLGSLPGGGSLGSFAPDPAALTPIGGVTLEQYVEISKDIAASGASDAASAASAASAKGVSPENWAEAVEGWNKRIKTNGGVAHQFNQLYSA
jgi:hypothetical protein